MGLDACTDPSPYAAMRATLDIPKLTDEQREKRVLDEFRDRCARPERLPIPGRTVTNVEVRIPGTHKDLPPILVMAHHDHIHEEEGGGNGIVDNWSSVCALLWLWEELLTRPTQRPVKLISFAYEETGRLGSRHYVENMDFQPHAVINLECLGPGALAYSTDDGDLKRIALATAGTQPYECDLSVSRYEGFPSDGHVFADAGCRTITLDGLTDLDHRIIHCPHDQIGAIVPELYDQSLTYIAQLLRAVDIYSASVSDSPSKDGDTIEAIVFLNEQPMSRSVERIIGSDRRSVLPVAPAEPVRL